jgi:hypothetical protein
VQIRSDDVDIQQFAAWVNEQNDVISKIEIGNEALPTERPTADTIQNVEEQYEVALPYQNDVVPFPESRSTALHRLKCTKRKLEETGLVQKYDEKIAEYIDKGYVQKIQDLGDLCNRPKLWYIPHFPVEYVNKPGKRRLVFDVY